MIQKLTIILVFLETIAFGQSVQIDTFRLEGGERFKDLQSDKMSFPIIRSGSKEIDSLINMDLRNRFTRNDYRNETIDSILIKWAGDQIVFLDFKVSYNQKGILSINISAEGCGAYCSNWTDYFNYSITDGKWLNISDLIDTTGKFKSKVLKDKEVQYRKRKEELKEMLKGPNLVLDTSAYEWALKYYEDCEKSFDFKDFAIYSDRLEIIEDCYLPNAIKNLTPIINLTYKNSEIEGYRK